MDLVSRCFFCLMRRFKLTNKVERAIGCFLTTVVFVIGFDTHGSSHESFGEFSSDGQSYPG